MSPSFLYLQLVDAAFPSGGFAHSAGLEAAIRIGRVDLDAFLVESLRQAASTTLPLVHAACTDPEDLSALDAFADASILSHVANRASRAQGRALASAADRIFDVRVVAAHLHLAPVFGALFGLLGVAPDDAVAAYLHTTTRTILSAAVRLGVVGPLEAQRMHAECAPLLTELAFVRASLHDVAQTSPLLEIYATLHDALDARLFQS